LIPIVATFVGAIVIFCVGVYEAWQSITLIPQMDVIEIEVHLIQSVDSFLLGLVLMIFSYGIYDLFVSKLEIAEIPQIRPDWLKFEDIGELKSTLAEVIVMILTITFFSLIIENMNRFTNVWTFLAIPIGIFFIALAHGLLKHLTRSLKPKTAIWEKGAPKASQDELEQDKVNTSGEAPK